MIGHKKGSHPWWTGALRLLNARRLRSYFWNESKSEKRSVLAKGLFSSA